MSARTMSHSVAPHFPVAALLWPHRADGSSAVLRSVVLIALGTALLTLSAKVNLPLPYVPMTLQTLVVLVIGAAYGWRLGSATVIAYLAEGAMGLPVFAGPRGRAGSLAGSDGRVPFWLCGGSLRHGLVERTRLGSVGPATVRRNGPRTHPHSRRRILLAGIWHKARRRRRGWSASCPSSRVR